MAFKPIQILINAKDNASSVFDKLQAKVAAVGVAILGYFGIQAFAGVVRGAGDFEAAMSRVQAATGAAGDELGKLRAAAEDVGQNTKFTAVEAADALTELGKAGLSSGEALMALKPIIAAATAENLSLATVSDVLTSAIMGMGLSFTDAARVADVLAKGAAETKTSILGLGQALSYAAPAAKSVGLSLEGTVAILGQFAQGGIDASRAGTALNAILAQFLDPASKFRNELALAGITTNNFELAIQQLAAAGPAGSKAILAVGTEAGPALRALLNQGIGALDGLTEKLKSAEGSAAATAKVMQDNLNGSLTKLAGVWDAVMLKLGTPVLPVLKDGVDQLANAFRAAVADGTVARFGESIATAFRNGIQFVRDFIATVDLSAVMTRIQEFADRVNETFTKIGEYATNAGNTLQLAYGVMSAGVNAVLTAIYSIGSVFAEVASAVMTGVVALREGLASVTFGELSESFKLAAEDARSAAQGFGDAAQAMRDKAAQALQDTATAAQTARDGFDGLAGATDRSAAATDAWALAVANARAEQERSTKAQAEATAKTQAAAKSTTDHATAMKAAQQGLATLRAEYAAAVSDGNWQRAAELQEQLNRSLRGMRESAKDAADAAALVDAAFGRLGVTSAAKLKQLAESARADFETIRTSGSATAEDLSRAFKVAAEAAIAANKGIAPAWVTAEAGVRGYKIAVDEAGRATLEVATKGAEGIDRMARSWHANREAIQAQADAMDAILMKHKLSADYNERELAQIERVTEALERQNEARNKRLNIDKEGYSLNTAGERVLAGERQEDVDKDIAQRYGQENVDNPDAQRARQLATMLKLMAQIGGNVSDQGSSSQIAAMRRELQELEARLLNGVGGSSGSGSSGSRPAAPVTSTNSSGSSSGGRSGGISAGGPVIQIVLNPGVDLSNRAEADRMARQLMPAIANLTRRGMGS
jgi:TP901 family phage tail tape measure protein